MMLMATVGGPRVKITDQTITDVSSTDAQYVLQSDGTVHGITSGGGDITLEDWVTPADVAPSSYECRATLNSGTLDAGTTGSWLALTTNRGWECHTGHTANLTIEIRIGTTVLDSATVVLDAT